AEVQLREVGNHSNGRQPSRPHSAHVEENRAHPSRAFPRVDLQFPRQVRPEKRWGDRPMNEQDVLPPLRPKPRLAEQRPKAITGWRRERQDGHYFHSLRLRRFAEETVAGGL